MRIDRTEITRKLKWENKQFYQQFYQHFKRLTSYISHQKTWTWLKNETFRKQLNLFAAQNNAIRTNHIKARIGKKQQNSKFWLCGNRDETISHIISKCSKLAQKEYKTWYDCVGKVIHCELCKKLKCDQTNKSYKHNPISVLENETHKLAWDFEIQTDHLISARRPDLVTINKRKRTCRIGNFVVPAEHRVKLKESKKKEKYQDFDWELKNCDGDTGSNWCFWHSYQRIGTRTGGLGYKKTSGDHPNNSIF